MKQELAIYPVIPYLDQEEEEEELIPTTNDPFPYGFRYVEYQQNGTTAWLQVPLTLEDVLHPQMGDYVNQTDEHYVVCQYLHMVLCWQFRLDPTVVVLCDVLVEWGVEGVKGHAPDIVVLSGVQKRQRNKSYDLTITGGHPLLVIEVTSSRTRILDIAGMKKPNKFYEYAKVGIPYYVVVDLARRQEDSIVPVSGYRLSIEGHYVPITPNEHGRIWLETVGMALGPDEVDVAWYDDKGKIIANYQEMAETLFDMEERLSDTEKQLSDTEKQLIDTKERLSNIEEHNRQLEAELRRLRGEEE